MRTFTKDSKDIEKQVKKVVGATIKALAISFGDAPLFDRIDVVIAADKHYKQSDFGGTAEALQAAFDERLSSEDLARLRITPLMDGDNNVGVLNAAFALQDRADIDFTIINSPSAASYLTQDTVIAMCEKWLQDGVEVVGVKMNESPYPTLAELGIVQNTLAGWDTAVVASVRGFDPIAALAPIGEENPNAGLEEVPLLFRIAQNLSGPFIGFVEADQLTAWELPAEGTEDRANHDRQMATKVERATAHAEAYGLELGILREYLVS